MIANREGRGTIRQRVSLDGEEFVNLESVLFVLITKVSLSSSDNLNRDTIRKYKSLKSYIRATSLNKT